VHTRSPVVGRIYEQVPACVGDQIGERAQVDVPVPSVLDHIE